MQFRFNGGVVGSPRLVRVNGGFQAQLKITANRTGQYLADVVFLGKQSTNPVQRIPARASNSLGILVTNGKPLPPFPWA